MSTTELVTKVMNLPLGTLLSLCLFLVGLCPWQLESPLDSFRINTLGFDSRQCLSVDYSVDDFRFKMKIILIGPYMYYI